MNKESDNQSSNGFQPKPRVPLPPKPKHMTKYGELGLRRIANLEKLNELKRRIAEEGREE